MNKIQQEDIIQFAETFSCSNDLRDSRFLITGATGLIGSTLIHCLLALNVGVTIIAPVRSMSKAISMFSEKEKIAIKFIECDICQFDYNQIPNVDYIIHCAAPTSSRFFVEHPVETFITIIDATKSLLDFAKTKDIKSIVFLSSLEVYGQISDDTKVVTEDIQGYLDALSVRSSYPMAKRAAENLCCLYASEYNVPVKITRLTQTTGAGIAKDDTRVIALFARHTARNEDIILHTTGEAARPYCYTTDAISAILFVLLNGESGEAYNVANENTYISARDMAIYLRDNFNSSIKVRIETNDNMGYAPITKLRLSTKKLKALGWQPRYDLKEMFKRLIDYIKTC